MQEERIFHERWTTSERVDRESVDCACSTQECFGRFVSSESRLVQSETETPVTDRAWAIGNLRKFGAPSAKFPQIANLQWSVSMSLNSGIHSEVLAQSGVHSEVLPCSSLHMRDSRWAGPPLTSVGVCGLFPPSADSQGT